MSSVSVFTNSESTSALPALALQCIEDEGLQTPSLPSVECIVRFALRCTDMLQAVALVEPSEQPLREFYSYCTLAAINRPAGIFDAAAE